jgi:hypothetical protein
MQLKYPQLLLLAFSLSVTLTSSAGTNWYVNGTTGSDSNNCTSAANPCQTIGHAISLAASGDAIVIAAATYSENLVITKNLKLTGSGAKTIVDGGGANHTVAVESTTANVSLSNLVIQNGSGTGGGGILNWGILTVSNSTVTGNSTGSEYSAVGGGIYNTGTLTLNRSTVKNNAVGAIYAYGGGICSTGKLAINDSTISANTASGTSGGGGGGVYVSGGTATINNSTISGNGGTPNGGDIYNNATMTIQNSIVANSASGGNCYGKITSNGYNLSSDNTCTFSNSGDINGVNPMLGPLQNNGGPTQTMALPAGSRALNAGNPKGCTDNLGRLLKTDQRGRARPDPGDTSGCDMGAYENETQ